MYNLCVFLINPSRIHPIPSQTKIVIISFYSRAWFPFSSSPKVFCRDAEIGRFCGDVAFVYNQPKHAILKKWLLLTDADDPTEPKGYLKVCSLTKWCFCTQRPDERICIDKGKQSSEQPRL